MLTLSQRIKDRLLKYDTLHGIYMIPLGIVGLWVTFTHLQYILHVIGLLVFMYAIIEGIRRIAHNPFKDSANVVTKRSAYLQANLPPAPPQNPA